MLHNHVETPSSGMSEFGQREIRFLEKGGYQCRNKVGDLRPHDDLPRTKLRQEEEKEKREKRPGTATHTKRREKTGGFILAVRQLLYT
jgi:hypothetical protein